MSPLLGAALLTAGLLASAAAEPPRAEPASPDSEASSPERERRIGRFLLSGKPEELEDLEVVLSAIAETPSGGETIEALQAALESRGQMLTVLYDDIGPSFGRYRQEANLLIFSRPLHKALTRSGAAPEEAARIQAATMAHELEHALQYAAHGANRPLRDLEYAATLRHIRVIEELGGMPELPAARNRGSELLRGYMEAREGQRESVAALRADPEAAIGLMRESVRRRYKHLDSAEGILSGWDPFSGAPAEYGEADIAAARSVRRYVEREEEAFRAWLASWNPMT